MHPSPAPATPMAVQNKPQGLLSPGDSGYRTRAPGLNAPGRLTPNPPREAPGAGGAEKGRTRRRGAMNASQSSIREGLAAAGLMPGGEHSVPGPGGNELAATTSKASERRKSATEAQTLGHLYEGGWHVVSIKGGDEEGGVQSHRTVLHPDEHVDADVLRSLVERELGFSYEEVHSVYRQGPLSATQRELRGLVDARMLALSRSGGSMVELGRALGFPIKDDGHCRVLENALKRAREEES